MRLKKMISRDEALEFLEEKIANKNIIKHMLAAEAVMRALARKLKIKKMQSKIATPDEYQDEKLKIDEEEWGLAGLLHDADYSPDVPENLQGVKVSEWLVERGFGVSEEVKHAMASHNHATGVKPVSLMDWSLFCADPLTGLIVATALVRPDKKLASVTVESVMKKYKDPSFAAGTRRKDIALCEEKLAIPLQEFVKIGLETMQKIADDLGL